jgi:hypothetical protein
MAVRRIVWDKDGTGSASRPVATFCVSSVGTSDSDATASLNNSNMAAWLLQIRRLQFIRVTPKVVPTSGNSYHGTLENKVHEEEYFWKLTVAYVAQKYSILWHPSFPHRYIHFFSVFSLSPHF